MSGNQLLVPPRHQGPCALHSTLDSHPTLQTFPSLHCDKATLMTGAPSSSSMACDFTTSAWAPALSGLGHITCSSNPQFPVTNFCNFCLVPPAHMSLSGTKSNIVTCLEHSWRSRPQALQSWVTFWCSLGWRSNVSSLFTYLPGGSISRPLRRFHSPASYLPKLPYPAKWKGAIRLFL